jgi:hypothetical protein
MRPISFSGKKAITHPRLRLAFSQCFGRRGENVQRFCLAAVLRGFALIGLPCLLLLFFGFGMPSARAQSAPPSGNSVQVKTHLKEILSQPEFNPEDTNSPMAQLGRAFRERWEKTFHWLQDRWKAFQKFLDRLFSFAGPASRTVGSLVSYIFAALAIGLGGWLVAWLIRSYWINRLDGKAKARTAFDESEGDEDMITEPNAWLQQAQNFADGADYRRAFRCVFLAILLLMDQGGLIEFDRSRTNGDYLRLLRRKNLSRLYETLRPLVLEFDRRWYGQEATNERDYQRILQDFEHIRALMTEEASAAGAAGQTAAGRA